MGRKIIITVLSIFNDKGNFTYQCDKGEPIEAHWTNEAGLKYMLRNDVEYTDMICLCSHETYNKDYEKLFKNIVSNERKCDIKMTLVEYSVNDDVKEISGELTKKFQFNQSDTVYIDTTGGLRPVVYYLVYLFRYLEYIGVKVESAIYSSADTKIHKGTIKEVKNILNMFDLINGAHEFTSTGNPQTLKRYFGSSDNPTIKNLLTAMQSFYDQISLCRIGEELDRYLIDMDKCLLEIEENSDPSDDEARLKEIIPVIRNKFFSDNKSRYLGLLKWCLNNGLLQQALTFYVEKLPKAYFTEYVFLKIDISKLKKKGANPGTDIYQDYFIEAASDDFKTRARNMIESRSSLIKASKRDRKRILISYESDCEKLYELIINIRDTFYDFRGNRFSEQPKEKYPADLLAGISIKFDNMPKKVEGLINRIKDNPTTFSSVASVSESSELKKLNGILKGLTDENVKVSISEEDIKKIRLDYLYMKYIRNQVNHASETKDDNKEFIEMFRHIDEKRYVFPKGNNFSAGLVRDFMELSVSEIEKISIQQS